MLLPVQGRPVITASPPSAVSMRRVAGRDEDKRLTVCFCAGPGVFTYSSSKHRVSLSEQAGQVSHCLRKQMESAQTRSPGLVFHTGARWYWYCGTVTRRGSSECCAVSMDTHTHLLRNRNSWATSLCFARVFVFPICQNADPN